MARLTLRVLDCDQVGGPWEAQDNLRRDDLLEVLDLQPEYRVVLPRRLRWEQLEPLGAELR